MILSLTMGTIAAIAGIGFAGHIGSEIIVDKVPLLRGLCRGKTQSEVADAMTQAIEDSVFRSMRTFIQAQQISIPDASQKGKQTSEAES